MKTSQCVWISLLVSCNLPAQTSSNHPWKTLLSAARAPEMPALVARYVTRATPPDRHATTVAIVDAAVELNPPAAPLVVAAVSGAVPQMAPIAAATSLARQPAQVDAITRAASAAAPGMAAEIVAALCKTLPEQYRAIALAASEASPAAGREILVAVGYARPALKPHLDNELARYGRVRPSVALTLDRVQLAQSNMATNGLKQTLSPLAMDAAPNGNSNGGGHPNNGDNGWHGGRNYAKP